MAIKLKEKMDSQKIHLREKELNDIAFRRLSEIKGLHILAEKINERLGVFSFYLDNIHHNLVTRLLNDRFGIQVRGGCSCAGTYGHFLLNVDFKLSREITDKIDAGDLSMKPGWIRLSLHPTMKNDELIFIADALKQISENIKTWSQDYLYDYHTNEFEHKSIAGMHSKHDTNWFEVS